MVDIKDVSFFDFIVTDAIYSKKRLSDLNPEIISFFKHLVNNIKGDGYCPKCNDTTIYNSRCGESSNLFMTSTGGGRRVQAKQTSTDIYIVRTHCGREYSHSIQSIFLMSEHTDLITKIGQIPSIADVSTPFNRYRSVLDPLSLKEMNKADGLAAHGVGIGSFVYLRRVYERIVDESFSPTEECPDIDSFHALDMKDRVKLISSKMPDTFLRCSTTLFGVLSSGIHSLSDDDCLQKYPILRDVICIVLAKRKADKDMAAVEEKLIRDINAMHSGK